MKTTTTKVLASILIVSAMLAAIALSYKGHAAEPDRSATEWPPTEPARQWVKVTDESKVELPRAALTVERDGDRLVTITVYDPAGKPAIVVRPDGNVDMYGDRKPEDAARLFWATLAKYVGDCKP
jgi:hypothetical protein